MAIDHENPGGAVVRGVARALAGRLRDRAAVSDPEFDAFLPPELRAVSELHWTPLSVVRRAASWLDRLGVASVVDIGSGCGKFCVAAALASRCRFTGIEERPWLAAAARQLALEFEVDHRVDFIEGALSGIPVPDADLYYMYNPFGENLRAPEERLDEGIPLGPERYVQEIVAVKDLFRRAPVGTYVLTYHGFGGWFPAGFDEVYLEDTLPTLLRLWRKMR